MYHSPNQEIALSLSILPVSGPGESNCLTLYKQQTVEHRSTVITNFVITISNHNISSVVDT